MIELLMHIIGICPDSLSHIDLIDMFLRVGPQFWQWIANKFIS